MKYMISPYGVEGKIRVALLDPETSKTDINLSHNLFNTHVNYTYYNGVLNFNSSSEFYRFLIHKQLLFFPQPTKTFREVLREASIETRQIIQKETDHLDHDFLLQIYGNKRSAQLYKTVA
jgi:hypothetical protein